MEKTEKTNELRSIAGRDIGEETLECERCGRFWGKDSINPLGGVIPGMPPVGAVGSCTMCEGFVYPKSKLPRRVSER